MVESCKQSLMTCPCRCLEESAESKSDERKLEEASEGKNTLIVTTLWQAKPKYAHA